MSKFNRVLLLLFALVICFSFQASAYAQADVKARLKSIKPKDFPTEPITIVVVYPAGGGMDVTARLLAKYVEKYIDSRVIVENRPGGNGIIGHTYLTTQAKNDGYTVGLIAGCYFWQDSLLRAGGKWSYKNLDALTYINEDPNTWVVSTDGILKDKSLKEVIAFAKQKPDVVKIAIAVDTSPQFLTEDIEMRTGAKFTKVPFQGGAPGVTAMLGGHVDIAGYYFNEYKSFIDAGKARVLGQAGADRSGYMPNAPTFNEVLGVNDILWSVWRYAAVPKGVAPERAKYLEEAILAALHDPECIKDYAKIGSKVGDKYLDAKQTAQEVEKQYKATQEFFNKTGRMPK
ncbi:MAG: tripartite tricarboxylate transporter substrate binding protein [Deltaproteobacteria bacterium]|nr:tripartite tricarboxylate transporter substrate binding protein [Deltaproteobacteria bacterium]